MPRVKMTDRTVKAIKPPDAGQVDYWDVGKPNFGMRVSHGGRRAWVVMYRAGGVKRRLTLGTYPELSLADARSHAAKALHSVQHEKGDPAEEKKADRVAETVKELVGAYIELHAKRSKRSWRRDERILNKDLVPRYGSRKAKAITRRDIVLLLDEIVARGAPIQANRTLEIVRKMFNWAASRDLVPASPCYGISKPSPENRSDRVLSAEEIKAAWGAFSKERALTGAIFKLRLMTLQRGGEVCAMRWDQIADGVWTIPADIAKNGMAHRVPLPAEALALLEELRPLGQDKAGNQCPWVFPSPDRTTHRTAIHKAHTRIRKASRIEFVPHDLRRTGASHMTSMGIPRLVVSKILNHAEQGVTAVYDRHSYDAEKRHALEAWNARLGAMIAGDAGKQTNVVALHA